MTDQQYQSLKALAALQGKTINEYAIFSSDPDDERTLLGLRAVLTQRIGEVEAGEVDRRSFSEIAEAVLSAATPGK